MKISVETWHVSEVERTARPEKMEGIQDNNLQTHEKTVLNCFKLKTVIICSLRPLRVEQEITVLTCAKGDLG